MTKTLIFLFLFLGSTLGSYLPVLWGGSLFSMTSILLSMVGGLLGISVGFKIGNRFE
ncbi:MAG: hypothetical protein ABI747_01260 [Candidatus Moraniibacteriota bacterium]